ncbi:MAG: MotE family protein [Pseudomonadota bacterium]
MIKTDYFTAIAALAGFLTLSAAPETFAASPEKPAAQKTSPKSDDETSNFCTNFQDLAREQRYALKTKELAELQSQVEKRIEALKARKQELEALQKKRDNFTAQAQLILVEMYSKMRPDAAAGRLEILEHSLAAALLMKLPTRQAGLILNEMAAEKAANLTTIIASLGKDMATQ